MLENIRILTEKDLLQSFLVIDSFIKEKKINSIFFFFFFLREGIQQFVSLIWLLIYDLSSFTKWLNKLSKSNKNAFSYIVYKRASFEARSNITELVEWDIVCICTVVMANFCPLKGTDCSSPVWQWTVNLLYFWKFVHDTEVVKPVQLFLTQRAPFPQHGGEHPETSWVSLLC